MTQIIIPQNYQLIFKEIISLAQQSCFQALRKVNTGLIQLHLALGKVIFQQTQSWWGDGVIEKLSQDLQTQFPWVKGFSPRNLWRIQMITSQLDDTKLPQLVAELPRWHVSMIFEKVKDVIKTYHRIFLTIHQVKKYSNFWSKV